MTEPSSSPQRSAGRYLPFVLLLFAVILVLIGGSAATLYLIFSEYSGIRNIWLLVCCAPIVVVVLFFLAIYTLYAIYGRPLRQIFGAIDSVAEGDLTIRVPDDNSPQFGELIKRFNKMVAELERSDQQRRNLTADIAHELRTPLHIIQGNLEGILDGVYQPSPEQIKDTLDEVSLMTRLVNDLQTLSLAESGQLPLHPTRFLLADLIQDLVSSFSSQAASLDIHLQTNISNPGQELVADYDRLNQILSNLISNALRHTPEGGTVSIETASGGTSEGRDALNSSKRSVRILVKDSGTGIPPEDLPFIFDRFWRGDKSRSDRTHSGLGLAITRQLIHAHGGTIDVQSDGVPGKGTMFVIDLPSAE
jgi:two-component system OmpR family sensor kinase/two-component system sensor histidine kinase BaeS